MADDTFGGNVPSESTGGNMPSENTGGNMPSENTGGNMPSENTGGNVPGENAGGNVPGENAGGNMPSENAGGNVPSENTGGNVPGENAGGNVPSENAGGNMPSENTGGNVPGENAGGNVPSENAGGNALSGNAGGNMPSENAISSLVLRISAISKKRITDTNLQNVIGEVTKALFDMYDVPDKSLISLIAIAISALEAEPPNIQLAEIVQKRITTITSQRSFQLKKRFFSLTPVVRVMAGLIVFFIGIMPLVWGIVKSINQWEKDHPFVPLPIYNLLLLIAFCGAVGSVVSIMVRISDFANLIKTDRDVLFLTGLFKPIIGTVFALFIYAAISGGLLPAIEAAHQTPYFFAAVSFLAGFSERFATDVATKTGQNLLGGNDAKPS